MTLIGGARNWATPWRSCDTMLGVGVEMYSVVGIVATVCPLS